MSSAEENWQLKLYIGDFNAGSRAERQAIANSLLDRLRPLRAYVPNLTSEQTVWLERELAALEELDGDAFEQKFITIERSPVQQLRKLDTALDNAIKGLECTANEVVESIAEVWCWSYVNLVLTDTAMFNEAIDTLSRSGTISFNEGIRKQFFLNFASDDPWGGYHILGRRIQEHIILPMLHERKTRESN